MPNQPRFLRIYNGWDGQSISIQILITELPGGIILGYAERYILSEYVVTQLANSFRGLFYNYNLSLRDTLNNEIRRECQGKS